MTAVLLVEHDPAVAELSRRYLARDGFAVRLARSPAEAAAAFAEAAVGGYRPDAVVLDLTMPGLSPREIRRALCQPPGKPGAEDEPAGKPGTEDEPARKPRAEGQRPGKPGAERQPAGKPGGQDTSSRGQRGRLELARPLVCLAGPGGLRPREVGAGESSCLRRPFGPRSLVASVRIALAAAAAPHGGNAASVRMALAAAAPAHGGNAASPRGTRAAGTRGAGTSGAGTSGAGTSAAGASPPAATGAGHAMQRFADVALTATERDLLAFLVANPGRVFTRERLLTALRETAGQEPARPGAIRAAGYLTGPDESASAGGGRPGRRSGPAGPRAVDVYVAQLRAKLGDRSPIRTVRGVGYAALL